MMIADIFRAPFTRSWVASAASLCGNGPTPSDGGGGDVQ